MSLNDFHIVEQLGEGSYSTVYKIIRKQDNQTYALKRVRIQSQNQKDQQNALNEIRILASIDHHNIVQYKEAFIDQQTNELCIVMEYLDQGDLLKKINGFIKTKKQIDEQEAVDVLHNMKICH